MKDIISQIKEIREINTNDKLVIFVGAGVSRNSGVCSWWELVKEIADRIDENKCNGCNMKKLICEKCGETLELCRLNKSNCENKYNFSSDDYLIIPQHYYENLTDKTEYENFLKEKFCINLVPNKIDEMIVSLNPEHIITTNYDHLIEDVRDLNRAKYTVIKNDDDMLSKGGRHYIIKMHGDIDELDKIVLKEDDYLKYSQNHIIIESYIKSLLIDKTFLFIGYSLNDNNLKLIMSYIDYFVKEKKISARTPHYLVVNEIKNKERDIRYWKNKGVELIDLSNINDIMLSQSNCDDIVNPVGKQLFAFLNYVKNDKLPFTNDMSKQYKASLMEIKESLACFKFISYKTLMEVCGLKSVIELKAPLLTFRDINEYEQFKLITEETEIRKLFAKARIFGIQLSSLGNNQRYTFSDDDIEDDDLFSMSLENRYTEIIEALNSYPASSEKAYYYSLIKHTHGLHDIMNSIKKEGEMLDYSKLTNQQYFDLSIYEFNNICYRILNFNSDNSEYFERLNLILDNAATTQSGAYKVIKEFINTDNSEIQKLNNILSNHEVYYMKKSTTMKVGGTVYGDLYKIQQVVYDYYFFYKKNHLMLDWFNNVEKMVDPYIKAILCTYYPDEYQFSSNSLFKRTYVKPYPLEIIDIDMIVKHVKLKNFRSLISYYKVFSININDGLDIAELFENFCISMKSFWNIYLTDQLEVFSLLMSLIELNQEQKKRVLQSYINLVIPDQNMSKQMLVNSMSAIWIFVQKHYYKNSDVNKQLLKLLIDEQIIKEPISSSNPYAKLIKDLSPCADNEIYDLCDSMINSNKNKREQCYFTFVYRDILLSIDDIKWKEWIMKNVDNNWPEEVCAYLESGVLTYNDVVKKYFTDKFTKFDSQQNINGVYSYPDNKKDTICNLIILLLIGRIEKLEDIQFLDHYATENEYLSFLFYPQDFDYSKIITADNIWCSIINNDKYREIILRHKSEFWTEDDEKRIILGFGSAFENRVAYKYFFD